MERICAAAASTRRLLASLAAVGLCRMFAHAAFFFGVLYLKGALINGHALAEGGSPKNTAIDQAE